MHKFKENYKPTYGDMTTALGAETSPATDTIETDTNFSVIGVYLFSVVCVDNGVYYVGNAEYSISDATTITSDAEKCEISLAGKKSKQGN